MLKDLEKKYTKDAFLEIYSFFNYESWSLNNPGDFMLILEACYCSLFLSLISMTLPYLIVFNENVGMSLYKAFVK